MSDLPVGWVEKISKSRGGKKYYFNELNGTTTWDKPFLSEDGKPEWEEAMTEDGKLFYKVNIFNISMP